MTSTTPVTSSYVVSITQPHQEVSTTNERIINIEGKVTPYISGTVHALGYVAPIFPPGQFIIGYGFLPEGAIDIDIVATADDGSAIGEAYIQVTYARPSEGSYSITVTMGG